MTEFQELMLYTCFGAMTGVFIAEIIFIIASAMSWVKDKIRKRKEVKSKESATKVDYRTNGAAESILCCPYFR